MALLRWNDTTRVALSALLLSVLAIPLHGYSLEGGDNHFWIPYVHAEAHPGPLQDDPLFESPQGRLSFFVDALAPAVRAWGHAWPAVVGYLVAHALIFVAFAVVTLRLLEDEAAALVAPLLLALPHPVGGSATVTLETLFVPRHVAEAGGLLALALALSSRPIVAGLAIGASFLVHPLTAVAFGAALLGRAIAHPDARRAFVRTAAAAALAGLPVFARYFASRTDVGASDVERLEWMEILRQTSRYAFVARWNAGEWLVVVLSLAWLLLGALVASRRRELLALAGGAAAWSAAGVVGGEVLQRPAVLALQAPRGLLVLSLLSLACAALVASRLVRRGRGAAALAGALVAATACGWAGWQLVLAPAAAVVLGSGLSGWMRRGALALGAALALAGVLAWPSSIAVSLGSPTRLLVVAGVAAAAWLAAERLEAPTGAALAAGLLLAAMLGVFGARPVQAPWQPVAHPSRELREWARAETAPGTVFALWPPERGFRAFALRAVPHEPGDGGPALFSREYALGWLERRARYGPEGDLDGLVTAVRAGDVDALALRRDVLPEGARGSLPVVHEDERWIVHAVRPLGVATGEGG